MTSLTRQQVEEEDNSINKERRPKKSKILSTKDWKTKRNDILNRWKIDNDDTSINKDTGGLKTGVCHQQWQRYQRLKSWRWNNRNDSWGWGRRTSNQQRKPTNKELKLKGQIKIKKGLRRKRVECDLRVGWFYQQRQKMLTN